MFGWVLWVACGSDVGVSGRVFEGHDRLGFPLADGDIRLLDGDGNEVDAGQTGARGGFRLTARANQLVFAEITAEGFGVSSFTGTTGVQALKVDDGALYGVETRVVDAWTALMEGCPGQADAGGLVYGEVRLFEVFDPETGEEPTVGTAWAAVESVPEGTRREACYLADDGASWAPDSDRTGGTGRFAVFGVPPGLHTLEVGFDLPGGDSYTSLWTVWMPDAPGAVVPRFPVYVEFPV